MIGSQSLLLDETALSQFQDIQKPFYVLDWLRRVEHFLPLAPRADIKICQKQLIEQLMHTMHTGPGVPTRNYLARCMASLFVVGDTMDLFETVNKCNDVLKSRDDSSTSTTVKLAATACLGEMYAKLGRMMGRSYEETVQIICRNFRSMESQTRIESLQAFEKICSGMDTAASSAHRDIHKIARLGLADRVMAVRTAAAKCLMTMTTSAPLLFTNELESLTSTCLRALDGADYDARIAVADLLGCLLAATQFPPSSKGKLPAAVTPNSKVLKSVSLEDSLNILMTGFLRGATSFLKGDIIKGTSNVNREVRVGVTYAYISFVERLGSIWLEKHLEVFCTHILELVANPKAAASHVDSVYSRKCVNFILRRTIGRLLDEKTQFSALKVIAALILKQMNTIDFSPENAKECNQETIFNQHLLVCALQELSALFITLGTSIHHYVTDPSSKLIDTLFSVLIHPCQSTRLSGAWAVRCLCVACPSEAHKSIQRCLTGLEGMKSSTEAVAGYGAALAALLGAVRRMPLGVPYATGKIVFNTAEELLRSANQNSRLSMQKSYTGWLLIGAIMTMGNSVVKALLPRMLLLWRNSFPRSTKDLESEKARGDAFTWQVTLEGRAGALSSIHSFLFHCPDLITDEIIARLLVPVESALAMMTNLSSTLKSFGQPLKASAANLRYRLYQTLVLIKPSFFERSYTHMLRFVIWELTLNDNAANTTTSLFTRVCQAHSILNSLVCDHMSIEEQLQPVGAAGFGAIEHDPCSLYLDVSEEFSVPLPLPLGVSVIDASIELFGKLYPHISTKHRNQLIEHFVECLKVNKYARKDAVLINMFCAFLCAMKSVRRLNTRGTDSSTSGRCFGSEELKLIAQQLVLNTLGHPSAVIRCAAAEVIGRIAQGVADSKFTSEMTQFCSDKLKGCREVANRMGHALALGCLHRYLGGMDSSRHLHHSVSILLNLAQDLSSPETQVWALHALALIADTGGPLFRSYVEPCLSLLLKLAITVPLSVIDLRQATGKLVAALITGFGPELNVGDDREVDKVKKSFETCCSLLSLDEEHSLVQTEAVTCYQRLHLFGTVNFSRIVPVLFNSMKSPNLALRRAAVDCFRQLTQRDTDIVCQHMNRLCEKAEDCVPLEYGISELLFRMMDKESDNILRKGLKDILQSIMAASILYDNSLQISVALCKSILTADSGADGTTEDLNDELDDDVEQFRVGGGDNGNGMLAVKNYSRWTSRVFAAECVRKILITSPHITNKTGNELLRHLSDLIRMSFMGATSNSDSLRLEGLLNLEIVIERFAHLKDPDFPTVSILEQFQAQVSAALRPAFSSETDPSVQATACRVCSAWICGNSQGGEDLRRVHTLMVTALENIRSKPTLPDYNEKANTLEKLAVLKAWAQVFNTSVENGLRNGESLSEILKSGVKTKNHLLELVKPQLQNLSPYWLCALRDRGLIELPVEFSPQLPREGGAFFSNDTKDVVRPFYEDSWAPVLFASALVLSTTPELLVQQEPLEKQTEAKIDRFNLIFGLSMEALCKPPFSESLECAEKYLKSIWALYCSRWPREIIIRQKSLALELCSVLHRQLVTRSAIKIQSLVIEVVKLIIEGLREGTTGLSSIEPNKNEGDKEENSISPVISDELVPGKSIVISILEVIFCLLIQKIAVLNSNISGFHSSPTGTNEENDDLVIEVVKCLESLPDVCSDEGAVEIQPTILYLVTCILGESGPNESLRAAVLECFRKMATHRLNSNSFWQKYLLSTLAKLLDLAKTDENSGEKNHIRVDLLSAITIFIRESPPELIRIPEVFYPAVNLYQRAMRNSDDDSVRIKTVVLICDIFEKSDRSVSIPFIHALAPRILEFLYSEEARNVQTKFQLEITLECVRAIEVLIQIVDSSEKRSLSQGVQMLTLIIPVLIRYLDQPQLKRSAESSMLYDVSLQKLMKIGPQYPQEFRALMGRSVEMRLKLESAIKASRSTVAARQTETSANSGMNISTPFIPAIKLKTDFSNFSK